MTKKEIKDMKRVHAWLEKIVGQGRKMQESLGEGGASEMVEEIVDDLEENVQGIGIILRNMEKTYERG